MSLLSHIKKDGFLLLKDWKGVIIALVLPVVIVATYSALDLRGGITELLNPDAFILVISTAFPVLLMASTTLVQERREGTLQRVRRSTGSLVLLVLSKTLTVMLLILAQVVVLLVATSQLLPHPTANWLVLGVVLFLVGVATHALGLFISSIVTTEIQAMQITALALLVMIALSGLLKPLDQVDPTIGAPASTLPVAAGFSAARVTLPANATTPAQSFGASAVHDSLVKLPAMTLGMLVAAAVVTRIRK